MNNITISLPKLVSCNSISSCSKVKHKRGTSNEGYIVEMLDKYNMKSWFLTDERQDSGHSSDILSNDYFKKVAPLLLPQYFSYFIHSVHLNIVDEGCNILC
jgi:hypothetical protein